MVISMPQEKLLFAERRTKLFQKTSQYIYTWFIRVHLKLLLILFMGKNYKDEQKPRSSALPLRRDGRSSQQKRESEWALDGSCSLKDLLSFWFVFLVVFFFTPDPGACKTRSLL